MDQTVADLVTRVLEADADAFAQLVAVYRPQFGRYAYRMLGNREDAEEALQDTFVRAYQAIMACRDRARFGAWAFTILVNRCRTVRQRVMRRDRPRVFGEAALDAAAVDHPAERHFEREEVNRALATLPPDQREAFLLKHVEELPYDEMANLTGSSVSALKMRVKRACERLRRELEGIAHA